MGTDNRGDDRHAATVTPPASGAGAGRGLRHVSSPGTPYGHGHRWALDADRVTPVRMPSTKSPPHHHRDMAEHRPGAPGRTEVDTWTTGPHSGAWTPTARCT